MTIIISFYRRERFLFAQLFNTSAVASSLLLSTTISFKLYYNDVFGEENIRRDILDVCLVHTSRVACARARLIRELILCGATCASRVDVATTGGGVVRLIATCNPPATRRGIIPPRFLLESRARRVVSAYTLPRSTPEGVKMTDSRNEARIVNALRRTTQRLDELVSRVNYR